MGAWGTAIFSDDEALDIKQEYQTLLAFGTPEEEAFELVKKYFELDEEDDEDERIFWLAIATLQEKYGILMPEVRDRTLKIIDSGVDLEFWEDSDKRDFEKRKKVLQDLKSKLLSPNTERKKIPKPSIQKRRFGLGDIVISQVVLKKYDDNWWHNKYVLFKVTQQYCCGVSKIRPKLAFDTWSKGLLFDWIGDYIPTKEEIANIPIYDNLNVHPLYWIPKNYTLKMLISANAKLEDVPFVKNTIECWTNNQANIFTVLRCNDEHFREIYEKYKK
jgi:hypothetical protein